MRAQGRKTAARRRIIAQYACPGCGAMAGQRCVTRAGCSTRMHVLRRNMAIREVATGPCPAGCGDELETVRNMVQHVRTSQFGCDDEALTRQRDGDGRG